MTDKQIIIDGVDCGYYNEGICWNDDVAIEYCNDCDYCFHKQIKQLKEKLLNKEQECERLSKGYAELTDIVSPYMDDFTGYNEELGGFDLILCIKELLQQLNQLKEENEILKEKITISSNSDKITLKIIKTLTEIKEIVSSTLDCGEWIGQGDNKMEQILNKISEVENG